MEGCRLRCGCAATERQEAELVVSEALRLCADEGRKLSDMAVLYRTNAQSRVLEEAFITREYLTRWWAALGSTSARR